MTDQTLSRVSLRSSLKIGAVSSLVISTAITSALCIVVLLVDGSGFVQSTLNLLNDITGFRLTSGWVWTALASLFLATFIIGMLISTTITVAFNAASRITGGLNLSITASREDNKADIT